MTTRLKLYGGWLIRTHYTLYFLSLPSLMNFVKGVNYTLIGKRIKRKINITFRARQSSTKLISIGNDRKKNPQRDCSSDDLANAKISIACHCTDQSCQWVQLFHGRCFFQPSKYLLTLASASKTTEKYREFCCITE